MTCTFTPNALLFLRLQSGKPFVTYAHTANHVFYFFCRYFSKMSTTTSKDTFDSIYEQLLTLPIPLLPPGHSTKPALTAQISSLSLHPALEAAFHILNNDLPSAHFLARHMQAAPAYEGMCLHGILHRIEGDYDNARAWYRNVSSSDVFRKNWATEEDGLEFIGKVEAFAKAKGTEGKADLEKESLREIKTVVDWCVEKFGKEEWADASGEYKQTEDEEHKQLGKDMITGDKGHRNF